MIFYGTRATNLKNGQIVNIDCPNCETNTAMRYSVFGRYAHIYWIPFAPSGKTTVIECNNCKKTYELKDVPKSVQEKISRENEKAPVRNPIWMFSGLFVIVIGVAIALYISKITDEEEAVFIKKPKIGDIYRFKTTDRFYSTMKVLKITPDSLDITINKLQTDQMTGIEDIDRDENYIEKFSIARKEITKMFASDTIYEINRD